ncbi:ATP-binding protein [Spirillospora sp. NPDC127200]
MSEPYTLTLEASADVLKAARDWAAEIFDLWGLDDYLGKLIVTELATNVVRHTDADKMVLRLYECDRGIVVEVEDPSSVLPVVRPLTTDSSTGRGLAMIRLLAADLGWNLCAAGGKCVYAVLPGAASGSWCGGPCRAPRSASAPRCS